jgi:hypothetical protein
MERIKQKYGKIYQPCRKGYALNLKSAVGKYSCRNKDIIMIVKN